MLIVPNNKLSNHYRKKKTEKTVWFEDQTFSGSFRQNMETMKEKTKTGMFYEDYLCPSVSYSNNYLSNFDNFLFISNSDFKGFGINPYANNVPDMNGDNRFAY